MPISTSEVHTRSGRPVVRSVYEGDVTVQEAQRFLDLVGPSGRYANHGHLVLGRVTGLSSEVKKLLGTAKPADPLNPHPVAMVIPSAMVRMIASLVLRAGGNSNTSLFNDEAAALGWLDERMTYFESHLSKQVT
jgi:hypothetical protein